MKPEPRPPVYTGFRTPPMVGHREGPTMIRGLAGRRILGPHGRLGMMAGGAGSMAWRRAAPVMKDGQDRHLIEQPMLGRCGSGTGWAARASSMAWRGRWAVR